MKKYQNAKQGFTKLFVAVILLIICDCASYFINQWWWLLLATAILLVVAFFINISGLGQMAKDDPGYKKAYIMAIIGIFATLVCGVIVGISNAGEKTYEIASGILTTGPKLVQFLIAYCVMSTSIDIAKKIKKPELASYTEGTLKLYVVVYLLSVILGVILNLNLNGFGTVIFVIVTIVAGVLTIISQVKYDIFLKMMADNL